MNTWINDKKVGDTLYLVPSDSRDKHRTAEIKITSIGRKLIKASHFNERGVYGYEIVIDKTQPREVLSTRNSCGSADNIYRDVEHYNEFLVTSSLFQKLHEATQYWQRGKYTPGQIKAACMALGIEVTK